MKRPSYFISARSVSADILASELVLALSDQFPKIECQGILGEWTGRTRSTRLGELSECLQLGLHDRAEVSEEALTWTNQLYLEIDKLAPEVAILVGYSFLHHELAGYFKSKNIPVVLYEITPVGAVNGIDLASVGQRVDQALGTNIHGSELVKKAGIPYSCIGSSHKDRVDRVIVDPQSLGFKGGHKIVSIFPGGRAEGFQTMLPVFQQLAESLALEAGVQVVLSVADNLIEDSSIKLFGKSLEHYIQESHGNSGAIRVVRGMHLELLSLSSLAITGCGAITVEASLFQVPILPIFPASEGAIQNPPLSMINQILGQSLLKEYSSSTPSSELLTCARELIGPSPRRESLIKNMAELSLSIKGFAADNAADYIGREIAHWKQSAVPKSSKSVSSSGL